MGPKDSHFPQLSLPNTGPFITLQDLKLSIPDEQYKTVLTEKLQRADSRSLIHGGDLDSSLAN
ncbi:hypothetical protein ACE6H2_000986 [Prunus campanulata]